MGRGILASEWQHPGHSRQPTAAAVSFDHCFERLELSGRDRVVVAVSGGSDSTALLHLFTGFARRSHPGLKVIAVTVDHGLRPEAKGEARRVGEQARVLGVDHVIRRWDGEKPKAGLMEAAREARHRLLAEAARKAGADLVLVAHTLNDQAETVAMRGKRGTGRGGAGMARATLYDWNTWFARPLLDVRRTALRGALTDAGLGWIDDPSNEDARYERVRVRAALDDAATETLAAAAKEFAADREELGRRAAALIERHATMPVQGLIRLDPAFAKTADKDSATYALRILLGVAGGQAHLPDLDQTSALLDRLAAGASFRATLSRAVADRRKAGLFLYRERRNLPEAEGYRPGIWDGRYRLSGQSGTEHSIGMPDDATVAAASNDVPPAIPASLARAAAATRPALWRGGACLGFAGSTDGLACDPVAAPWARYLPSFDIEPARAVARLVGAAEPSAPPCARHKERKA